MITMTPTFSDWILRARPNPQARLRLFCFPYAGGGASTFREWSNTLPAEAEVCLIQLPGRERRLKEAPFTRLAPLVQALTQALHPLLTVPFAFFGHSMGALISFELARQLRRHHALTPTHLFISAHRAPQLPAKREPIHHLPGSVFIEQLRCLNGTPELVLQNTELMQIYTPLLRADFAVCETYTYANDDPLECSISAFGGLQDQEVSRDELVAWRDQTNGSFILRMLPGDHFFLQSSQRMLMQTVSEDLTCLLRQV